MGYVLVIFVLSCFFAALYESAKIYFEDWSQREGNSTPTRDVEDIPDNIDQFTSVPEDWDTGMVHSVSWDVATREVTNIVWREDFKI